MFCNGYGSGNSPQPLTTTIFTTTPHPPFSTTDDAINNEIGINETTHTTPQLTTSVYPIPILNNVTLSVMPAATTHVPQQPTKDPVYAIESTTITISETSPAITTVSTLPVAPQVTDGSLTTTAEMDVSD